MAKATTAVTNWQERLGALAKATAAAEVVSGRFLSFRSGQMKYNDAPVPDNSLLCVVVGSVFENHYYEEVFNPNNITSPVCFAFGRPDVEGNVPPMVPHKESLKPQHAGCDGCPQNAWASDPKGGRGKACKEIRRLAVIPADALKDPDKLVAANVAYARVPVMSVRNWSGYCNLLAAQGTAPLGVVTRMWLTPDPKSQFTVNFEMAAKIKDDDVLGKLFEKMDSVMAGIDFPYEKPNPDEAPAQTTAAKAAGRKSKVGK